KPSLRLKDDRGESRTNLRASWRQPRWLIVAAGALVLTVGLLYAGILLRVDTKAGTIVVEVDQPELAGAVVSVDGQQKITIQTPGNAEPIEIKADDQQHTLQVVKGGFETFTKSFTVKSGASETIRVRLEPTTPLGKAGTDTQRSSLRPGEGLVESGI